MSKPQARLSTGAGRLGLQLAESRVMPAASQSKIGILPEVLADLTGPVGNRARSGLPEARTAAPAVTGVSVQRNTTSRRWTSP